MKILALHGIGSSGAMLRKQLKSLMALLGPEYDFTFFDGTVCCPRGPGMPKWYDGPYYSYLSDHTPADVGAVLGALDAFIESNGPFDGILGFSHGGAIAATYILNRQMQQPRLPPQFSFAIFVGAVGPFSSHPWILQDEIEGLLTKTSRDPDAGSLSKNFDHLDDVERIFMQHLSLYRLTYDVLGITMPSFQVDYLHTHDTDAVPRFLHPLLVEDRIDIPTVHVTGNRDMARMRQLSFVVQGLCDESRMRVHRHQGGHSLPLIEDELRELASSVNWAATQAVSRSRL